MPAALRARSSIPVGDAVRAQRLRTIAVLEGLSDARWETEVVKGWRVREVAAHLITTDEASLTGRLLRLGLRQVPIEDLERWNDEQVGRWAERPIGALLHGLEVWGRRVARAVRVGAVVRGRMPTPLGKVSLRWLGGMRVYDEWIHMEDVRRALDLPADDDLASLRPVVEQLIAVIPIQTLPRIGAGGSGVVRLEIADVGAPRFAVDLGVRRYGAGVSGADAVVRGAAVDLVMVAAGREAWRDAESAGRLTVTGDRAPAEVFLDALLAV